MSSPDESLFAINDTTNLATTPQWTPVEKGCQPQVTSANGTIYQGDCVAFLQQLEPHSTAMVFADPPYNVKKAHWDDLGTIDDYVEWCMTWIQPAAQALTDTGSLFICGYPEILANIQRPALEHFEAVRWTQWHYKNRANLGSDWGRSHESILHFRKTKTFKLANIDYLREPYGEHTKKYPAHAQGKSSQYGNKTKTTDTWTPHPMGSKPKDIIEIPTTCNGMGEKTPHPTQKPEELVRKYVLAASTTGDLVVDPFSGSGTTAVVATQLGRRFKTCDLSPEYNTWAAQRLEVSSALGEDYYFELDKKNSERRKKIR